MTSPGIYPRSVTPGIENHDQTGRPSQLPPKGAWIGLDWIRLTGPEQIEPSLLDYLISRFGDDYQRSTAGIFFSTGRLWEPGLLLSTGHRESILMVDVRGQHLKLLSGDERVEILRELANLGMKPTRIDAALDFIELDLSLYINALASCKANELCHLRRYSPDPEYSAQNFPLRQMLKLGKRDSSVCARIYDKGLEQKLVIPRIWERLEVEWKKERAPQVAQAILDAGASWPEALSSLVVGAVDFRCVNGRTELNRRPRPVWWNDILSSITPSRIASITDESTFHKWLSSFQSSYGARLVQLAEATGMGVGALVEQLLHRVEASTGRKQLVDECVSLMQSER